MYKIKLFKKDFEYIRTILEDKDKTKISLVQSSPYRIIMIGKNGITELFITSYMPDTLVVQRVIINNKRKGIFTKVLAQLKNIAKTNGFKTIMIQSVITKQMSDFCIKNGFKASNNKQYPDLFINYTLEVV